MHTVRQFDDMWEVVFHNMHGETVNVIGRYTKAEDAFGICSYLNGGLPPAGHTMGIINYA